jgi:hypothetical protein
MQLLDSSELGRVLIKIAIVRQSLAAADDV